MGWERASKTKDKLQYFYIHRRQLPYNSVQRELSQQKLQKPVSVSISMCSFRWFVMWHMISIFFCYFFLILNWHHRRFTLKSLRDEENQNCCSKAPRLSRTGAIQTGAILALLRMPCKCSLALGLKGGLTAPHKTTKKNKKWNLLAICYAAKGRYKHPCSLLSLECLTHQAMVPFWSKFSLFSGIW